MRHASDMAEEEDVAASASLTMGRFGFLSADVIGLMAELLGQEGVAGFGTGCKGLRQIVLSRLQSLTLNNSSDVHKDAAGLHRLLRGAASGISIELVGQLIPALVEAIKDGGGQNVRALIAYRDGGGYCRVRRVREQLLGELAEALRSGALPRLKSLDISRFGGSPSSCLQAVLGPSYPDLVELSVSLDEEAQSFVLLHTAILARLRRAHAEAEESTSVRRVLAAYQRNGAPVYVHTHGMDGSRDCGLRRLALGPLSWRLSPEALASLLSSCKNLESLDLWEVANQGLDAVGEYVNSSNLKELKLDFAASGEESAWDRFLGILSSKASSLRRLKLHGVPPRVQEMLSSVMSCCTTLESLDLDDVTPPTITAVRNYVSSSLACNLKELKLDCAEHDHGVLHELLIMLCSNATRIHRLHITGAGSDADRLLQPSEALASAILTGGPGGTLAWPLLEEVAIPMRDNEELYETVVRALSQCPLKAPPRQWDDGVVIRAIEHGGFRAMTRLALPTGSKRVNEATMAALVSALRANRAMSPWLERLDISAYKGGGEGVRHMATTIRLLPRLRHLCLGADVLTDGGGLILHEVAEHRPQLTRLKLTQLKITHQDIPALVLVMTAIESLRSLALTECGLDGRQIQAIAAALNDGLPVTVECLSITDDTDYPVEAKQALVRVLQGPVGTKVEGLTLGYAQVILSAGKCNVQGDQS